MEISRVQAEVIEHNYRLVQERIAHAAESVGRDVDEIKVVVVTKAHPLDTIRAAVQAGLQVFGENYIEEGVQKITSLEGELPLEWHMIGHIQSRKAEAACRYFHWIHSLDSVKLAHRLDRFAEMYQKKVPVLLQFNISGEGTKHGWAAWDEALWENLLEDVSKIMVLPNLDIQGVMGIPPFEAQGEAARPFFRLLRRLRDFLRRHFSEREWPHLSMGMSADYEVAVQEGATMLRIGTAILGPRI